MQFTIFQNTDSGAPVLNGTTGSLISVLDACLTTGYGAISGLGWTKEYSSGAVGAVYRMSSASSIQFYLKVLDNGPGAVGGQEARLVGFESMTSFGSGQGQFPSGAVSFVVCRKSNSGNASGRQWTLIGDERTFYFFSRAGDVFNTETPFYGIGFGEIYSNKSGDNYRCMIIGRENENYTNAQLENIGDIGLVRRHSLGAANGHYLSRSYTQQGGSMGFCKVGHAASHVVHPNYPYLTYGGMCGLVPFPTPNGGFMLSPLFVIEPLGLPANNIRGTMRGLWHWMHNGSGMRYGNILTGTNDLSGKTFFVIQPLLYADSTLGIWYNSYIGAAVLEISNTLATN